MKRVLSFLVFACLVSSCGFLSGGQGDRRVAAIGREVLYESEVRKLLPQNVTPQDSAAMVRKYIDTWALSKLMLLKAQEELSKKDKDIDAQIEDYKRVLLGYRYEKLYVESRLDTVVSDDEISSYYDEHTVNYVFPYSILKARVVKISPKSPYYEMVRNNFPGNAGMDIDALEELCYSSAERYTDFSKSWIPVAALAKEIGEDVFWCESNISKGRFFEKEGETGSYLVYVSDYVEPNELSPVEYNKENIKETIISRRKQDLLSKLERDLLGEAINKKKLKIYEYDE
ncbi:MAG: hypothetical protein KBT00_03355 [Bacteroidales bacterium]|nr:hypothetical protein [Candidatus Cacconaster merdequi]